MEDIEVCDAVYGYTSRYTSQPSALAASIIASDFFTIPQFDLRQVSTLCGSEKYRGRLLFSAGEKPYLSLRIRNKNEDVLRLSQTLVADFAAAAEE